jgi:hypothetical membrane protein
MSSSSKPLLNLRVAGTCGILGQSIALFGILLAISISPWFSWTDDALSDLGSLASPDSARIFNTGLIVGGIITFIFAIGLSAKTKHSALGLTATILLFASCSGTIGVGLFPEDYPIPHVASATLSFVPLTFSLLMFGYLQLHTKQMKKLGATSIMLGLGTIVSWFIPLGYFVATLEMIAFICGYVWLLITSARLIASKDIIPRK